MQTIEVSENRFENIEGLNDIQEVADSITAGRKKRLEKKVKSGKGSKRKQAIRKELIAGTRRTLVGGIAQRVKESVTDPKTAPLVPLRPVMIVVLSKKGIKANNKTSTADLANLFYENVVRKDNKNLQHIDINELDEDYAVVALSVVVDAIISFIKSIKDKKKAGETLNKTEEVIATGTEMAEKKIEEGAKDEAAKNVGSKLLFDRKTQIVVIGVVIAVVIGVIYFTKHHKS
jgi:hypothetical protein